MPDVELAADCDRCFGLCCVLLPFRAADGFARDKAGGEPCGNLDGHDRCGIHERLAESGWPGCAAFDCLGAGQQVAQVTYGAISWRDRDEPHVRAEMGAALSVMLELHRMLARLEPTSAAYAEIAALRDVTPEELLALDLDELAEIARLPG